MKLYRIKEVSDMCNITRKTIRYYEMQNLVLPYKKENKVRFYRDDEVMRLKCICFYRCLDFSIATIKELMYGKESRDCLLTILRKQREEIETKLNVKIDLNQRIKAMSSKLNDSTSFDVEDYTQLLEYQESEVVEDFLYLRTNAVYRTFFTSKEEHKQLIRSIQVLTIVIGITIAFVVGMRLFL